MQIQRIGTFFALFVICASFTSVNADTSISTTTIEAQFAIVLENDEVKVTIVPSRGWRVYKYEIIATGNDVIAHDSTGGTAAQKHTSIPTAPEPPESGCTSLAGRSSGGSDPAERGGVETSPRRRWRELRSRGPDPRAP